MIVWIGVTLIGPITGNGRSLPAEGEDAAKMP
jgi:hypothetical protein